MTMNENDASFSTADAIARAQLASCDRIRMRICHLATWLRATGSLGVVHHERDGKKINLFG